MTIVAICRDVWDDIYVIGTDNKERIGYPTQKPESPGESN